MTRLRPWLLFPLTAMAAGCASTPEVRTLSDRTGRHVTALREGTAEFVAAQNRLNAENESHLQQLAASASAARARVARQRLAWTKGGQTDILDTQAMASSVTAADVVAQLQPSSVQPATVSFAGGKGYADAAEALTKIGTKPTAKAVLLGLAQYANEVRASHEALQEEAAKDSEATAKQTADADNAAMTSAGLVPTNAKPKN